MPTTLGSPLPESQESRPRGTDRCRVGEAGVPRIVEAQSANADGVHHLIDAAPEPIAFPSGTPTHPVCRWVQRFTAPLAAAA